MGLGVALEVGGGWLPLEILSVESFRVGWDEDVEEAEGDFWRIFDSFGELKDFGC